MPSFAPDYTTRYRAHYRAAGLVHTIQFRRPRGTSIAAIVAASGQLHDIFNDLAIRLCDDFEWISAEAALTDDTVFNPVATPTAVTGTVSIADFTIRDRIQGATFSGRVAGSKARFTMFGMKWPEGTTALEGNDFVVTGSEDAGVAAVVSAVTGNFCANNGVAATFYNKCTIKPNDHLVALVRRGVIS